MQLHKRLEILSLNINKIKFLDSIDGMCEECVPINSIPYGGNEEDENLMLAHYFYMADVVNYSNYYKIRYILYSKSGWVAIYNNTKYDGKVRFDKEFFNMLKSLAEEQEMNRVLETIKRNIEEGTKKKNDCLYLMFSSTHLEFKIGRSANPKERLLAIQRDRKAPVELVLSIEGMGDYEKYYHAMFYKLAIKGEWFSYDESILRTFRELHYSQSSK